ncbi:MAG: pyridoxamine 5'-phosphate oxidase family protein [Leptolyngbyaceae bacterium]|nr:pyridoxamine 5'-phosphate oxidase family protein [Leptolyngbyaceae bacterium]
MPPNFTQIAFTPTVKAIQEHYGSRQSYARMESRGQDNNTIDPFIAQFIQARDGFYMGTRNSEGWPYIQFRGGPTGFLNVLDEKTLGFADFGGNAQYLSIGNLADDDRVFLFLMDYMNRARLKIWGRATVEGDRPDLIEQLRDPDYPADAQRAILIRVEAWDWNCPQHIPRRFSENHVISLMEPLQARIQELEAQLAALNAS